jgi:hypothetical protein
MSFGIIIVCSNKDFSLAKGCLASVKYFMPDVDVCLLIDGDVDTTIVEKAYKCTIIKRSDIQNKFLKENSFGWGITKMNAFWESPFDEFILLDADICVWGNILEKFERDQYDMIVDQPQYGFDNEAINKWFFDTSMLSGIDPIFKPEDYCKKYFCTGIFYSKKEVFDLKWYQELFEYSIQRKDLFKFGEMGMLNYMIFKSVEQRKLNVANKYIQHICPDFERSYSAELFPFKNGMPSVGESMVIHYNGNRKPYLKNRLSYHEPMTFFRSYFYQKTNPELTDLEINAILRTEDKSFEPKVSLKQRAKNIIRPFVKPLLR